MRSIKFAFVVVTAFLTGCAFNVAPYGASVKNVESLKSTGVKPISVAKFQAAKPGLSTITCRAAGPVTVSPNFETFIESAFIDELKLAGVYDPKSSIVLTGKLEEVDFSSGMTDGKWMFTVALKNSKNDSFVTKSVYPFAGSFIADRARQEVAQAFGPAVQKLIGEIVSNPQFKQLAN